MERAGPCFRKLMLVKNFNIIPKYISPGPISLLVTPEARRVIEFDSTVLGVCHPSRLSASGSPRMLGWLRIE